MFFSYFPFGFYDLVWMCKKNNTSKTTKLFKLFNISFYSFSSSSIASLFFIFFIFVASAAATASFSLDGTTLFTRLTTFRALGEPPLSVGASTFREPNFSAKRLDSASERDDAFFVTDVATLRGDFADTRRVPGATGCITREEEEEEEEGEEEEVDGFLIRPLVVARSAPVGSLFFRSGAEDAKEREKDGGEEGEGEEEEGEEGFSKSIPYGLNVVDDGFVSGVLSSDMKTSAPKSLRDACSRTPAVNCFMVKPACS